MSLKRNIVANYLGQGWTALMHLAFIPLYIKYMGLEAYGLIGIYIILQAVLTLLDMGMTPTLNREMARYTAGARTLQSIRELLFSLELLCSGLALVIAVSVWTFSSWFAEHWLRTVHLPLQTVSDALAIMGLVAALRFIESIYRGAILGLQTHVWLNAVNAALATARGLGAVGILIWVSPSITAFFVWQGFISLISVIILAIRVHHALRVASKPVKFSILELSNVWNFARGMIATTFLSLLLTQVDKILLSRILSLENFGTYMLAAAVAGALMLIVAPLAQGYYPRFTELVAQRNEPSLIAAYHQASQFMAVMVAPISLLLIFQSETVLILWTTDEALARSSAPLVALLALGTAFLGLMNIPYMLQLAYGWSIFAAKVNAVIVIVQIPVLYWSTLNYGAIGAAWVWVGITCSYIFVVVQLMHKKLLPKEKWKWYWQDNFLPIFSSCFTGLILSFVKPVNFDAASNFVWLIFCWSLMFLAAFLAASNLRFFALRKFNSWRTR